MREILFRIKDHERQWHYGCPAFFDDGSFEFFDKDKLNSLLPYEECGVGITIDKTLGQYTGFYDKNGTTIFEGDILIGDIPELIGSQNLIGIVEYQESAFVVKFPNRKSWQIQKVGFCSFVNYKVIGNIYDNPELLGENNG